MSTSKSVAQWLFPASLRWRATTLCSAESSSNPLLMVRTTGKVLSPCLQFSTRQLDSTTTTCSTELTVSKNAKGVVQSKDDIFQRSSQAPATSKPKHVTTKSIKRCGVQAMTALPTMSRKRFATTVREAPCRNSSSTAAGSFSTCFRKVCKDWATAKKKTVTSATNFCSEASQAVHP